MKTLQILTFGKFEIYVGEDPIILPAKSRALLLYLVINGGAHTRQTLAGLLWSDMPEEDARASLRVALNKLRNPLRPWLIVTHESLAFNFAAAYYADALAFERVVKRAANRDDDTAELVIELAKAIPLNTGDFVPEFTLDDAPLFDEWILGQREHYRQMMVRVLEGLAQTAQVENDWLRARDYWQRLLQIEPLLEEAHRGVMLAMAALGYHGEALTQYQICARILRAEMGIEPSVQTQATLREIENLELKMENWGTTPPSNSPFSILNSKFIPTPPTPFVGRQTELADVQHWLNDPNCRLITLVGLGGSGKTRLALETARLLASTCSTYFVPLSPISDAQLTPMALLHGLQLSIRPGDDPKPTLVKALQTIKGLIVLDNIEHIMGSSTFIAEMMLAAPHVKWIATSRQALGLADEVLIEVGGFRQPAEAAQLFVQRANRLGVDLLAAQQSMRPAVNADINRICKLVAYLPLAIELAAAWTRALPLADIGDEIARNIDFLASLDEVAPGAIAPSGLASQHPLYTNGRHRSLRATFDYSWKLLTTSERSTLGLAAIFADGFTRDAIQRVSDAPLRALVGLVNKSLLRLNADGRYQLHETVQQFALEKAGDLTFGNVARYATYYAEFVKKRERDLMQGPRQAAALAEMNTELANIRAAWRYALDQNRDDLLEKMTFGLIYLFGICRPYSEGLAHFADTITTVPPKNMSLYGKLLVAHGYFAHRMGNLVLARVKLEKSVALLRQVYAPRELGMALLTLSYLPDQPEQCVALANEAHTLFTQTGDAWGTGAALNVMGEFAKNTGHLAEARQYFAKSLEVYRRANDAIGNIYTLAALGETALLQGDVTEAEPYLQACLDGARMMQFTHIIARVAYGLGNLARQRGDAPHSLALFKEAYAAGQADNCVDCMANSSAAINDMRQEITNYELVARTTSL